MRVCLLCECMRVFYCVREYACVLLCERVCVCFTV